MSVHSGLSGPGANDPVNADALRFAIGRSCAAAVPAGVLLQGKARAELSADSWLRGARAPERSLKIVP
jgi:hypothetical protein